MLIMMSFSMIFLNIFPKPSIQKRRGFQTAFLNQAPIVRFPWAAWANKTRISKKSPSWRGKFKRCRVRTRRMDSKLSKIKIAFLIRMDLIQESLFKTNSSKALQARSCTALGEDNIWIRRTVIYRWLAEGWIRTWMHLMMQPSASHCLTLYTKDKMKIKCLVILNRSTI